jgi:hypothetical protein
MCKLGGGLLAAVAAVVFLADARSQTVTSSGNASSFLTGANPRQINFTKVDTSKAMQAPNLGGAFAKPAQQTPVGLNSMFPKISLGSWPPKLPNVSILPTNPFNKVVANPKK